MLWTKLNTTLKAGSNIIQLIEPVDWKENELIVVGATSFNPFETENFKIASVSEDGLTVTLTTSALYTHLAYSETLPSGESYEIAAPVGLLTRNVKIIGGNF